jgi:hypothetical protein
MGTPTRRTIDYQLPRVMRLLLSPSPQLTGGVARAGAASTCALVAIALLASGMTVGAVPNSTTIAAPYHGTVFLTNSTGIYGCAKATAWASPHFALKTGTGGLGVRSSSKGCGGPGGTGSETASIAVSVLVRFATAGFHRIAESVSVRALETEATVLGHCAPRSTANSYCTAFANQSIESYAALVDSTNGSALYSSNFLSTYNSSLNYSYCSRGSCHSYSVNTQRGSLGAITFYVNGSFKSGHKYVLITFVLSAVAASTGAYQSGLTGASASSRLDLQTAGNGFVLTSISIT